MRSIQSGCGTSTYPSDFASYKGYKIPFTPGYWILSSSIFIGLPLTCSCHSCACTDRTISAFFALSSAFLLLRRWGGSCTGWARSPALHCSGRGNIWLVLVCLWRKGRGRGQRAWSRSNPRVQHNTNIT